MMYEFETFIGYALFWLGCGLIFSILILFAIGYMVSIFFGI